MYRITARTHQKNPTVDVFKAFRMNRDKVIKMFKSLPGRCTKRSKEFIKTQTGSRRASEIMWGWKMRHRRRETGQSRSVKRWHVHIVPSGMVFTLSNVKTEEPLDFERSNFILKLCSMLWSYKYIIPTSIRGKQNQCCRPKYSQGVVREIGAGQPVFTW